MTANPSVCRNCARPRTRQRSGHHRGAHGWCGTCTNRWYRAGKPASGVPERVVPEAERIARITATCRGAQLARIEDYAELRSWRETREAAARRAGVSVRWARRVYEPLIAAGVLEEAS